LGLVFPKIGAQLVRGFLMGAADVVPGVSGGTIALIVGIYEKLIEQVRAGARALGALVKGDLRGFWSRVTGLDYLFLVPLAVGILLAVGGLASILETQLEENPEEMAGLFFGLVAGSVLIGWDLINRRTSTHLAITVVVAIAIFFLLGFSSGPIADPSPGVFVGAGALAICAMILPGISGSFILLMIGMYAAVIGAVDERAFADIALVGVGAVVGLALFSTFLGWLLDNHGDNVMAAMVGLMLGSLRVLWPWPNGVGVISENEDEVIDGTGLEWPSGDEVLGPVALCVVGFVLVMAIAQVGKRFEG
jgi:putative membrane protein